MDADMLAEFLRERYYNELLSATEDKSVVIDFNDFDRYDPPSADMLLDHPEEVLAAFQEALKKIDMPEQKINIRFRNLPEKRNIRIRNLRAKHLNKLWCIDAVIKAASEVLPQIYEIIFECPACNKKITVPQDSGLVKKPYMCECGTRGDFKQVEKKLFDTRWLTCVEPFEITTGEQPGKISIFLKEDMTTPRMQKKTDPGNRMKITGILKEVPKRLKGKLITKLDMIVDALFVEPSDTEYDELEITQEDEKMIIELSKDPQIYEKLKASIAPAIYGFDEIKESIVMQLFGGVPHVMPDGTRIRGNIHILLTGDPGIGKTQILKLVSSIVPRGRYVSGSGVSGAGLTATVVKDEILGGWVLEAGALILCNKGLIAIDEFDKMSKDDQIAMHEATSVETVSIAKASIMATLPAQTAVLAGANPKHGRFDTMQSIVEQIMIPETLLSRFDLKFALRDRPDRSNDERLAEHIIISRTNPEKIEPVIPINILKKYIAYSKQIDKIELLPEASDAIKKFYVDMRNMYASEDVNVVSITFRQYEALLRLAEASAKVRLERKVTIEDADRAIRLMKFSLQQLGMDQETGRFDIDVMESGMASSKRKKIGIMLEIITGMQETGRDVAISDIEAEAQTRGIEESDARDIIERLRREGTIFEPRAGYVRKT